MNGYLLSVIGTVLFCSILTAVMPQGKTATMVNAIARLACIIAILAPIPAYLSGEQFVFFGETVIETDNEFIKYCSELRVQEAGKKLEDELNERYDTQLSVTLLWGWENISQGYEQGKIAVYQASIVCGKDFSFDSRQEIVEYVDEQYGFGVVFYEDGNI